MLLYPPLIALAFEVYSRLANNIEAERRAAQVRLRAEKKAGALDKRREKAKGVRMAGRNSVGGSVVEPPNDAPTLARSRRLEAPGA